MVLLEVKRSEKSAFLVEMPYETLISEVTNNISKINNQRVKIQKLI